MRAAEHSPRDPFRVLERRHGPPQIIERGARVVVDAEMMRLLRPGGRLVWATSVARATDDGSRVVAGAMRAAGFVDVKIDVMRLQGAARWTPVVATKPR